MQFRTRTLFVMMATLGVLLALTSRAPVPLRVGAGLSLLMTWLGIGLVSFSCRQLTAPRLAPLLVGMLGIGLTAIALSTGVVLTGVALESQFGRQAEY